MAVETRVDGSPDGIRATGDWLRDRLAGQVDAAVGEMESARSRADAT
jgi:hypothetical protein